MITWKRFFISLTFILLLAACGGQETTTDAETEVPTVQTEDSPYLEYVELQWVEASLESEGEIVLINDLDQEMTVLEIEIEQFETYTRTRVIDAANGQMQCEVLNHESGGGSASHQGYAECNLEGSVVLHGDWHLGSGNTVNATVAYAIFIPLNEHTQTQTVNIYGPNGWTDVEIYDGGHLPLPKITAKIGETQICEFTADGTYSRMEPSIGASCILDRDYGYGVVIYGNHSTVTIEK